jgi:hypothetical protein
VSFISALHELEPVHEDVLNLASTLGTRADDGAASHLRFPHLRRERDDSAHGERLRRVMSRLSRLDDSSAAYGDRVPSANTLYDWSPATDHDDAELDAVLDELRREQPNTPPEILRVLGRSQLDAERERLRSISTRLSADRPPPPGGESLRSTAILQSVRRHPRFSARTREYLTRYNADREASSRPAQHSESPARYTSYMSESARQMAQQRLLASEARRSSESRTSLDRERRDMLSRADSYRRNYLDHHASSATPVVSPLLEKTVKYLSRIRHAETIDDSLNHALDAGFLTKDYFCMQYADFLTDTAAIPPPAETSWLAPGAVLSGCQHATTATSATAGAPGTTTTTTTTHQWYTYDAPNTGVSGLAPPRRPWLANSYTTARSRSAQLSPEATPAQPPQQDRWPVKVTIHEVDWQNMSLSATMEAYNVPSHPNASQAVLSGAVEGPHQYTRTSSITTFLEGEILDFNAHTLLTESFVSNAANDATYWRKLPPFANMSDEEVVKALTSKTWYNEVLNKEWVLMRWKERCFVKSLNRSTLDPAPPTQSLHSHAHQRNTQMADTPYRLVRDPTTNSLNVEFTADMDTEQATFDDSGCGLTISGFYYVCLRRCDGGVHGLYFDPQSSPYQCLELESRNGGAVGAWGLR